jgi:spore maturation protein SpmA
MLNYIWLGLILLAVVLGGINNQLKAVTEAAFEGSKTAVMGLALPLIGVMALWLGLMKLADQSGLVQALARALRPVMRWLFPEVPVGHPAMGSMLLNISANMLGLANAATPLGLKAMKDLERLNPHPGTATNAMCTFLAINTSSVQLIPASTIALLASAGSQNPTAIVGTALMATTVSTAVGITTVKLLQGLPVFRPRPTKAMAPDRTEPMPERSAAIETRDQTPGSESPAAPRVPLVLVFLLMLGFFGWLLARQLGAREAGIPPFTHFIQSISLLAIPFIMLFIPLFAALRNVPVYEQFIEGAKEGFETGIRIIPYLVAMLAAIGMFRAAGGIEIITRGLEPILRWTQFPSELVPLALLRPLSGSGSNGIFAELIKTHGPDHLLSRMAGTLMGSTETTFYVIAVYFGSVGVRRVRHALAAGLLADLAGIIAAIVVCRMVFAG